MSVGKYFSPQKYFVGISLKKLLWLLLSFDMYVGFKLAFYFLSLALLPRHSTQECSDAISVHCNLCLVGSSDSPAPASWVAGTSGVHHSTQLIFVFFVGMEFCHVGQAGLELLTSDDPPPQPPKVWDYRCEPLCPAYRYLLIDYWYVLVTVLG